MPKAPPGYSGGKLQRRSKAEGGRDEKKEEETVRRVGNEVMKAIFATGPIESAA